MFEFYYKKGPCNETLTKKHPHPRMSQTTPVTSATTAEEVPTQKKNLKRPRSIAKLMSSCISKPSVDSPGPTPSASMEFEIFCKLVTATKKETSPFKAGQPWPSSKITVSVPADDEECPITMELIKDSNKMDWLPEGCSFVKGNPGLSKATLECGHSFSAVNLVYLWCKKDMRCPCCRKGFDLPAGPASIPTHFRSLMMEHIKKTIKEEKEKDEEESMRETQSLFQVASVTGMRVPYTSLASANDLSISVTLYNQTPGQQAARLAAVVVANLRHGGSNAGANGLMPVFSPPSHQLRVIADHLSSGTTAAVTFHIMLRIPGHGRESVYIESTELLSLSSVHSRIAAAAAAQVGTRAGVSLTIPGLGGQSISSGSDLADENNNVKSNFHVSFGANNVITELTWVPNSPYLDWFAS